MSADSAHACPGGKGPSGGGGKISVGTILCILLLLGVVVYIVGGIVYNVVRKTGKIFPNTDFWLGFPGLIKDGVMFIVNRGKGGTYTEV